MGLSAPATASRVFVDPSDMPRIPMQATFEWSKDAQRLRKPIYYSYAACGAEDEYSGNITEACVNQEARSSQVR